MRQDLNDEVVNLTTIIPAIIPCLPPNSYINRRTIESLRDPTNYSISRVLKMYGKHLLKCVTIGGKSHTWYFWDNSRKIWSRNDIFIGEQCIQLLSSLLYFGYEREWLTRKERDEIRAKIQATNFVKNCLKITYLPADDRFMEELDACADYVPFRGGKKFNLLTGRVEDRCIDDYCTKEFKHQYLTNQRSANIFEAFLRSMFPDDTEFKFIRMVLGYMMQRGNPQQLIMAFQHPLGGNGKSILLNTLTTVFDEWVTQLSRDIIFHKKGNLQAEYNKINKARIAFVEEATESKHAVSADTADPPTIDLNPMLQLSGTQWLVERDNYQKGTDVQKQYVTASPFLLMNSNQFAQFTAHFWKRRFCLIPLQYTFVPRDDPRLGQDPFMKPADPALLTNLIAFPNHTFTFILNCMRLYRHDKPQIRSLIPDRIRNADFHQIDPIGPPDIVTQLSPIWNRFIATHCRIGSRLHVSRSVLLKRLRIIDSRFSGGIIQQLCHIDGRFKVQYPRTSSSRIRVVYGLSIRGHRSQYTLISDSGNSHFTDLSSDEIVNNQPDQPIPSRHVLRPPAKKRVLNSGARLFID